MTRAVIAIVAVAATVVAVVLVSSGEKRRVAGSGKSAQTKLRDAPPERPARRRPRKRLTDAQAIERVRRITPYVSRGHTRRKLIALTFDDGPGPITPALHAQLRRMRVPATFFQVADLVNGNPAAARAGHRRPFTTGSHTASHARLTELGPGAQRAEIAAGAEAIEQNSGRRPRLFRAPYGAWNDATMGALKRRRELMVFWSVSSRDWLLPTDQAIADRVIRLAHPGAIVLMHDFGGITREPTLRAVPRIVRALRRKGYRFVTVPEMLRQAPPRKRPPRPPSPYPL